MTAKAACLSWEVAATDLAEAASAPEHFAHVILWNWQRGQCAACGECASESTRMVRDHDHETGLLRGLLCHPCNVLEGVVGALDNPSYTRRDGKTFESFKTDPVKAARVARIRSYLAHSPAALLGLTARHSMTKPPFGLGLPVEYTCDLPVFDVDQSLWVAFYRSSRTATRSPDRRMDLMRQFFAWYAGRPGADAPPS